MKQKLDKLRGTGRMKPKYEIIRDFLLGEFTSGEYETGQALPSEHTLAKTAGVARTTVRQALGMLEKEGLINRIQGKGNYFTGGTKQDTAGKLEIYSLIVPDISRGLYPTLAKGFDYQAGQTNQQIMVCNTSFDINRQGNIILQMIDKNVAGVVLVPALTPSTPPFHVRQLQNHGIPVVFCHRRVQDTAAPLITWDREEVARIAGQTFIDHGHRRIAYFAGLRYLKTEAYENGLRHVLAENGLNFPEHHVYYGDSIDDTPVQRAKTFQALKAVLSGNEPVTAIFCHDDDEAEMVHHLATEIGVAIPKDVSLIGFGDSHDRSGVFRRRLTSVVVDEFELGTRAAHVLHDIRSGLRPMDSTETVYVPLTLVMGETVSPVS